MFDCRSALIHIQHQERDDLARQMEQCERFLAKQSTILREKIPDASLRDVYDRRTSDFGGSVHHFDRGTTRHVKSLFLMLENQIHWFEPNSRDLPKSQELRLLLGRRRIVWEFGTPEEKRKLLNRLWNHAKCFYTAAIKSIQTQWTDAERAGRQEQLTERWKRQMLQRLAYRGSGSGSGVAQTQAAEVDRRFTGSGRPERPSLEPAKTWVEFHLIDENGRPVPDASYRVKLPDGSVRNGKLDGQGMARFDDIDPGQCEFTFTEIDAKEWRPAT
jgi:hypothetical protein